LLAARDTPVPVQQNRMALVSLGRGHSLGDAQGHLRPGERRAVEHADGLHFMTRLPQPGEHGAGGWVVLVEVEGDAPA